MARAAGVRVHEFGIGFPPRARILHRGKETVYTLNWLPIGGFVRLEGEEGESDDPRAFVNQRLRTRLVILLAGVAMNFLLAWLIFSLIAGLADPVANVARRARVQAGLAGGGGGPRRRRPDRHDAEDGTPHLRRLGRPHLAIDGQRFPVFADLTRRPAAGATCARTPASRSRSPSGTPTARVDGRPGDPATAGGGRPKGALGIGIQAPSPTEDIQRGPLDADRHRLPAHRRRVDAHPARPPGPGAQPHQPAGPGTGRHGRHGGLVPDPAAAGVPVLAHRRALGQPRGRQRPAAAAARRRPGADGPRSAASSATASRPTLERSVYLAGWIGLMAFLVWITLFDIRRLVGG